MADIDQYISEAFGAARQTVGRTVTYWRDADNWVEVCAVAGQTNFASDNGDIIAEYRTRDYIFQTCDLFFADVAITPQRGDQIREEVGSTTYVYEVGRPDGSEQVWRYSDTGRAVVRVHTKLRPSSGQGS